MTKFKAGDVVKIQPQWRDPGDDSIDWICLEDEDEGRVLIEAQVPMRIKPTQRVETKMIEHRLSRGLQADGETPGSERASPGVKRS